MFKAVLNGKTRNKVLKDCSCLIPISVGQSLHEGEKLEATIELINATFASCTIVIADTLYRHTTQPNAEETETELRERTKNAGSDWQARNAKTLSKITIPHKVLSWDTYLELDTFSQKKELIERLYGEESRFKKAVDGAVGKFIDRHNQQNSLEVNIQKAFDDSLEYLKEECAVWLLWAEIEKPNFLVYPNKLYEPLSYLRRYFPDKSDVILESLTINFQTVKQSFSLEPPYVPENGHSYVPKFAGGSQQNPSLFFQASPPVNMSMSKSQLFDFIDFHYKWTMENAKSMDTKAGQEFLKYSFAHMNSLIYPITVTDDSSDSSSDSDHSDISGSSPPKENSFS